MAKDNLYEEPEARKEEGLVQPLSPKPPSPRPGRLSTSLSLTPSWPLLRPFPLPGARSPPLFLAWLTST